MKVSKTHYETKALVFKMLACIVDELGNCDIPAHRRNQLCTSAKAIIDSVMQLNKLDAGSDPKPNQWLDELEKLMNDWRAFTSAGGV
jgi:hypothetical protein